MEGGDSDDALICCVDNTVKDHIMDSGASFHATYCKKELERFKLRSGKVRLADDKILDIVDVEDVVLKISFGTSWTLKDVRYIPGLKRRLISVRQLDEEGYHRLGDMSRIGMNMLASKGNIPDVRKVDIYFSKPGGLEKQKNLSFIISVKIRKLQMLEQVHTEGYGLHLLHQSEDPATMILLSKTATGVVFGVAERLSRTFRAESTGIRLRIPKEKWRGKDTSLTHLKATAQTKCDTAFEIRRVTKLFEADVDSNYEARGPKIVGASRIVEDQMKNTLKTEHLTRMEAPRLHMYEDPPESPRLQYTKSLIHLVKNLKVYSWAKLVRILISEGSLSLLKILGMKSLAAMFNRERLFPV
nr:retrovirus-related Pol polyprotein from transposon TNT 1-94 [Tanacetum cinerariifolium]